jgi:hypothetical protein
MKNIITFLKKNDLYYSIARYALAAIMLRYSVMKICGMQFVTVLPFSSWGQSLEHLSGYQLTWAFLGHSYRFGVLMGIFEFVPACLLLFRRTAFAGAILMLPMTVGILMVNYSMDLWSNTKTISLVLLALNIIILFFERKRLANILSVVLTKGKNKYFIPELIIALLLIGSAVYKKAIKTTYHRDVTNQLTGQWFSKKSYEFSLVSERINDSLLPHRSVRAYFDPWSEYSELNDSINNGDGFKYYEIDEKQKLLYTTEQPNIKRSNRARPYYYHLGGGYRYELSGDSLILRQAIDDSTEHYFVFLKRALDVTKLY